MSKNYVRNVFAILYVISAANCRILTHQGKPSKFYDDVCLYFIKKSINLTFELMTTSRQLLLCFPKTYLLEITISCEFLIRRWLFSAFWRHVVWQSFTDLSKVLPFFMHAYTYLNVMHLLSLIMLFMYYLQIILFIYSGFYTSTSSQSYFIRNLQLLGFQTSVSVSRDDNKNHVFFSMCKSLICNKQQGRGSKEFYRMQGNASLKHL